MTSSDVIRIAQTIWLVIAGNTARNICGKMPSPRLTPEHLQPSIARQENEGRHPATVAEKVCRPGMRSAVRSAEPKPGRQTLCRWLGST
jgi:hypothetical protein